jgi:hypothetical protein
MAKVSRQKEFDREFRGQIERFTEALVKALRVIVSTPVPPVVKVLSFEMQSDWRDFPVYAFAMDDAAPNEVYFKRPFNGLVLPRSKALVRRGAIDQDAYEDAGIDTYVSGARALAEWFGECWHATGGAKFSIPAYINHHDSSRFYDLRKRKWVRDTDIWP